MVSGGGRGGLSVAVAMLDEIPEQFAETGRIEVAPPEADS
jgi:hypothetical protein